MVVVGEGEINLKTERLNLSLKPVPKGGIGTHATGKLTVSLDELTRPFKLGGTLAHPSLAVDLTQTAIEFGQAIGGVMLFGPAGIAALLVGSSSGDENSCMAAIEAAKKGVRVEKGLVGKVTRGRRQGTQEAVRQINYSLVDKRRGKARRVWGKKYPSSGIRIHSRDL